MLDREGFRPNVGIILLNSQNEVWWGKRVREHSWQFPQGGIKFGETPEQAMFRELEEEVSIECNGQQRIVGLIYDSSTEVGRVHLGIVHIMQLSSCKVQTREEHLEESGFQSVETIQSELDNFENWSQLCIKHLYM